MPSAAFLSALNLVRNATGEQLRVFQNPRELELALHGIGISTKTPTGWIAASFAHRPGLKYFACNGLDIYETFRVAQEAADYARKRKRPVFLHVGTIRLYGHAGADVPTTYLSREEERSSLPKPPERKALPRAKAKGEGPKKPPAKKRKAKA